MDPDTKVAGDKTVRDWQQLRAQLDDPNDSAAWRQAVEEFLRERIKSRFLDPAKHLLTLPRGVGFSVLALDCLLIDTIQSFKEGRPTGDDPRPAKAFKTFFQTSQYFGQFNSRMRAEFFDAIRNGIMHDGEARGGWKVRAVHPNNLATIIEPAADGGFVLYRGSFHEAVEREFVDYSAGLLVADQAPGHAVLRENFLRRMDAICGLIHPEPKLRYFAYGSNMNRNEMVKTGVLAPKLVAVAHLDGYRVAFNKVSRRRGAAANLQVCEDDDATGVWGALYELTPEQFGLIKEKEQGYFEAMVQVELGNGATTKAITFIARYDQVFSDRPCLEYQRLIVEGAEALECPDAYIESLKQQFEYLAP